MADLKAGSTAGGKLLITKSSLPTDNSTWSETQKLQASDAQVSDGFGYAVSISNDGLTCVVGAYLEDGAATNAGAAYIYQFYGTWVETQKLLASDAQADDNFGYSVSMSNDGLTCIVGAWTADGVVSNEGAAYIFVNQNGTWIESQKIQASDSNESDLFGRSVSISGDGLTCIVGAINEDTVASASGAVYVFENQAGTWVEVQKLKASDAAVGDNLGLTTSMSDDGLTCIIGTTRKDSGSSGDVGAAYIFENQNNTWVEIQKIQSSDIQSGDHFGSAVSISGDALTCIVGADLEDTGGTSAGAAYIFENQNGTWTEVQKLQASDKQSVDLFGSSASISADGLTCVVGATGEDTGESGAGAAYVFENQNGIWTEVQKFQASDRVSSASFGNSTAISGDGLTINVGARTAHTVVDDTGAAYIFERY